MPHTLRSGRVAALVIPCSMLVAGCHTVEGAAKGTAICAQLIGECGNSLSEGRNGAGVLIVMAAGPVIGAMCGLPQDLEDLWRWIDRNTEHWFE